MPGTARQTRAPAEPQASPSPAKTRPFKNIYLAGPGVPGLLAGAAGRVASGTQTPSPSWGSCSSETAAPFLEAKHLLVRPLRCDSTSPGPGLRAAALRAELRYLVLTSLLSKAFRGTLL
ncbi:hypothetical protein CB1_000331042 [Camelus ferus]|nr:hypothetical protein CB1_000331042 [Camelus ferus]